VVSQNSLLKIKDLDSGLIAVWKIVSLVGPRQDKSIFENVFRTLTQQAPGRCGNHPVSCFAMQLSI
jgi:hypothetical protein